MADAAPVAAGDVPPAAPPAVEAPPPPPPSEEPQPGLAQEPQPAQAEPQPDRQPAEDGAAEPAAAVKAKEPAAVKAEEPAAATEALRAAEPTPAAAEVKVEGHDAAVEAKEEPEQAAEAEVAEAAAAAEDVKGEAAAVEGAVAEEQVAEAAGAAAEGQAEAPSDAALVARLRELLGEVDLATTTEKQLRKRLEGEYGLALGDRKALLRAEINAYLEAEEGGEGEEAAEEEVEEEEAEEAQASGGRKRKAAAGSSLGSYLSPDMQDFLGEERLPRTQVVKRLWEYIKENNLQDPKNKRVILFDDKLKVLFPGQKTDMFKLQKLLSKHCKTSDVVGGSDDEEEEEEGEEVEEGGSDEESAAPAAKKPRRASSAAAAPKSGGVSSRKRSRSTVGGEDKPKGGNAFTKECTLSPEMAAWFGAPTASRPAITKHFWAYCKERELQDPSNRSFILADDALKGLTGEARFKAFGFSKFIKQHIIS